MMMMIIIRLGRMNEIKQKKKVTHSFIHIECLLWRNSFLQFVCNHHHHPLTAAAALIMMMIIVIKEHHQHWLLLSLLPVIIIIIIIIICTGTMALLLLGGKLRDHHDDHARQLQFIKQEGGDEVVIIIKCDRQFTTYKQATRLVWFPVSWSSNVWLSFHFIPPPPIPICVSYFLPSFPPTHPLSSFRNETIPKIIKRHRCRSPKSSLARCRSSSASRACSPIYAYKPKCELMGCRLIQYRATGPSLGRGESGRGWKMDGWWKGSPQTGGRPPMMETRLRQRGRTVFMRSSASPLAHSLIIMMGGRGRPVIPYPLPSPLEIIIKCSHRLLPIPSRTKTNFDITLSSLHSIHMSMGMGNGPKDFLKFFPPFERGTTACPPSWSSTISYR